MTDANKMTVKVTDADTGEEIFVGRVSRVPGAGTIGEFLCWHEPREGAIYHLEQAILRAIRRRKAA